MDAATIVFLLAVGALTLVAALWDLRTRKLPNWLTVSGFAAALVYHGGTSGLSGLGFSLLGFLTGFGILLVMWLVGSGGAGDVKLMGALGAWLGAKATLVVFVLSGALVLVGYACWIVVQLARWAAGSNARGRSVLQTLKPAKAEAARPSAAKPARGLLPFAVPVAVSTWLLLLAWMLWDVRLVNLPWAVS